MEINLAIAFLDVCDSTRLYEQAGNVEATTLIQNTLKDLRQIILNGGGKVIKSLGDGLMITFATADEACKTAHALIDRTEGSAQIKDAPVTVRIRIGLHYGSVVQRDHDLFGDAINVAARVESLASPGEILATDEILTRAGASHRSGARLIDTTAMRGKTVPIRIFKLMRGLSGEESIECTIMGGSTLQKLREGQLRLHLWYQQQSLVMGPERPKISIGRLDSSDIMLLAREASRQHGVIEFQREAFMITDHSSNGTFIQAADSLPILLRRDSAKLVGQGLIGFGAIASDPAQPFAVRYRCEFQK